MLQIKYELAEFQLELTRRVSAWKGQKAFNPNQPRVPAGNSDGGQWTDDGGGASSGGTRIRLADDIPTNDTPEFPKNKPSDPAARSSAIQAAARLFAKFGGPLGRIIQGAQWLYEYEADIKRISTGQKAYRNFTTMFQGAKTAIMFTTSSSKLRPSETAIQKA